MSKDWKFKSAAEQRAERLFDQFHKALTKSLPSRMARRDGKISTNGTETYTDNGAMDIKLDEEGKRIKKKKGAARLNIKLLPQ